MNLNKLRESVEFYKPEALVESCKCDRCKAIKILVSLAEDVIRLQGVMPKKKTLLFPNDLENDHEPDCNCDDCMGEKMEFWETSGYNKAIDDCIMAQAGKEIVK